MADVIDCPVCLGSREPAAMSGPLIVCGQCGASLVQDDDGLRRATHADVQPLSDADRAALKSARSPLIRHARRH
jgi:hypothetical protein